MYFLCCVMWYPTPIDITMSFYSTNVDIQYGVARMLLTLEIQSSEKKEIILIKFELVSLDTLNESLDHFYYASFISSVLLPKTSG